MVSVEDWEGLIMGGAGEVLRFVERVILAEGEKMLVDHVLNGDGAAAEGGGGGGVVGRNEDGGFVLARQMEDGFGDGASARDNEHPDGSANGQFLNVFPVADENQEFFGGILGQAFGEGLIVHGPDHEDEFFLLIEVVREELFGLKGGGEMTDGEQNPAGIKQALGGGTEEPSDLEDGDEPEAGAVLFYDWEDADISFVHDLEGMEEGGVWLEQEWVWFHHIADARGDIGDESRRWDLAVV